MSLININILFANDLKGNLDVLQFIKWVQYVIFFMTITIISFIFISCKKIVETDPPINSITTVQVFSNDADATSVVTGIYSQLINTQGTAKFSNGAITLYAGMTSDELAYTRSSLVDFYNNSLLSTNSFISTSLWNPMYLAIYKCNATLEGLNSSAGVSDQVRNQLIGEVKLIRAFCYFYLVNLFGDVPLVVNIDWKSSASMTRASSENVYEQIVSDLKDAQSNLAQDYSLSKGERSRPNAWAASALLARVYLYLKDWPNAEATSTIIINNSSLFKLETDLNKVFLKTSVEAIWQLQPSNISSPYATTEGASLIPFSSTAKADYYLTPQLLNIFDATDKRKAAWTNKSVNSSITYVYPYKYKVALGTTGSTINEYYMVLRLAEQYLIRAEARVYQDNLTGAISDINSIRARAGISSLLTTVSKNEIIDSIGNERMRELFAEWGHRWFDLKRTNKADDVLAPLKGNNWQSTDKLYPIPYSELQKNPNLDQNLGY